MKIREPLFPLVKAVEIATGRRPHLSTVLRWATSRNRFGVVLESTIVGGRRMTSVEAVDRFNAANTQAADPLSLPVATTKQRSASHDRDMRELAEAGV